MTDKNAFPAYKTVLTASLIPYARNSRTHSEAQVTKIAASIKEFGFLNPIITDGSNSIVAGHGRVLAAQKLGLESLPVIEAAHLTDAQRKAYIIADNRLALDAGWDNDMLKVELQDLEADGFDLSLTGFDIEEMAVLFDEPPEGESEDGGAGSLAERFGIPPFSVLNAREGVWQDRKRAWHGRIGDKGESREGTLFKSAGDDVSDKLQSQSNGVSLLDPVLAEICVAWFGKSGGLAFDPFAGDTVFGFVAGSLGMEFHGIELRKEQSDLNQARCKKAELPCTYYCDTSENMDAHIKDGTADLVFTCPPYADLEVYSDNPKDLSTMSHDDFFQVYKRIMQGTFAKLKNDRFAVVVMGEVRGKSGAYIGTIPKTIQIMEDAGYQFYNEIILVTSTGTLPLRAGRQMVATRKIGKTHQNVLVFLKGNAKAAVASLGEIQIDFGGDDADNG